MSPESKRCCRCGEVRPAASFWADRGKRDGLQSSCKDCQRARYRERLESDPEAVRKVGRESARRNRKKQLYGITNEQFEQMARDRDGHCDICDKVPPPRSGTYGGLVVDHDHETREVRGLLCHSCNRAIGLLGDDADRVMAAAAYLLVHHPEQARRFVLTS